MAHHVMVARLDTARALILHPEEHRSLGEIAEAIGFAGAAALSKAFRRRFGCSPREARRSGVARITGPHALFDAWRHTLQGARPDVEEADPVAEGRPLADA